MKAFMLLLFVFAGLIFLASTSLANVDLTPDTAIVYSNDPADANATVVEEFDIVSIQDDATTTFDGGTGADQTIYSVPVTGSCTNPYTVRQGDSLSSIAELCDVSMAEIRLANPEIVNANLIYAGQQLSIPDGTAVSNNIVPVPVTSGALAAPPQVVTNPLGTQDYGATIIAPGTGVQVTGIDFPANAPVYIAIGPQNTGYTIAASGVTDANGQITANLIVPTATNPNEPWVVVIATSASPVIQAASAPFLIQP